MISAVGPLHSYSVVPAGTAAFRSCRLAWNSLVDRARYPSIFCSWDWTATWWEHFGAGRELRLLMIYCGGELKGILPLFLQKQWLTRDGRLGRVLGYCTAADLYPDPLDIVCADHDAEACVGAVLAYLQESGRDWDVLHLRYLTDESHLLQIMPRASIYEARVEQVSAAPYIEINGSYEGYLAKLSANERSSIRRRRRKLLDAQGATYTDFRSDDAQQLLSVLFDLHAQRAAEKAIDSSFAREQAMAFHRSLLSRLNRDHLWLRGLKLDNEIIAVFYGFQAGGRVFYYQLGHNPRWAASSPGSVLLQETIREAFAAGMAEFNFLQGDEAFKYRWAHHVRPLYSVDLFNTSVCGRLAKSLSWARQFVKTLKGHSAANASTPAACRPGTRETHI